MHFLSHKNIYKAEMLTTSQRGRKPHIKTLLFNVIVVKKIKIKTPQGTFNIRGHKSYFRWIFPFSLVGKINIVRSSTCVCKAGWSEQLFVKMENSCCPWKYCLFKKQKQTYLENVQIIDSSVLICSFQEAKKK